MKHSKVTLTVLLFLLATSCGKKEPGIYASGTVEAREVLISSKVAGTIAKVHVERSRTVKAGEPLVDIDPEAYSLQLKEASAAFGAAQQLLAKAERGLRPEEIAQAREGVRAARSQYRLAKDTLDRQEQLIARDAISRQDYDVVKNQYKLAAANLTAAKKRHQLARKGARVEDIEAARFQVDRARAAVELAQLQESYSKVASPGEMMVSEIYVEEGELAGAGTALIMLQDLTEFHIDVFVSINEIAAVEEGAAVKIEVTGYPGRVFGGVVERVKPRAEFTPENITTEEGRSHLVFKVRVKITEGAETLKPGLPADAWITPAGGEV